MAEPGWNPNQSSTTVPARNSHSSQLQESFPLAWSQTVTHYWLPPRLCFSISRVLTLSQPPRPRGCNASAQLSGALSQHLPVIPKELILIFYADLLPQEMSISCIKRKPRHAPETRLRRTENQYREKVILRDPPGRLSYSQGSVRSAQGNEKSVRTVLGISSRRSLLMISRNTFH